MAAEEDRRKEVEEYGFNPNHDPTLPAVISGSEMAEDSSGYRGWGNTTNVSSNRKASTTISGGVTGGLSDSGSNPGGYHSPGSPTQNGSNADSGDPLMSMKRRSTMDSDALGALGQGPVANGYSNRPDLVNTANGGVHRGPSNASSSYSAHHSDSSENGNAANNANRRSNSYHYNSNSNGSSNGGPQDYYPDNGYYQAYNPSGGENGAAGTANGNVNASANGAGNMWDGGPIVQNVAARRNTRIENPVRYPPQGNSGIAQNF